MTSKRNSRVVGEDVMRAVESISKGAYSAAQRSRNGSSSDSTSRSSSREDYARAPEMEAGQSKKDDDAVATKGSLTTSISKANKAHVMSLDAALYTQYPAVPNEGRPVNFGIVLPGVYRSSYPQREDYAYLTKLGLKTLVTLVVKEEGDRELTSFVTANGINHVIVPMKGTKKEAIPDETMRSILKHVLDRRNYPLLLHCNHGKHRTGCVVGVMRKLGGWDAARCVEEYRSYANPKVRETDVAYISAFEASSLGLVGRQEVQTVALKDTVARFKSLFLGVLLMICAWMFFQSLCPKTNLA